MVCCKLKKRKKKEKKKEERYKLKDGVLGF